MVKYQFFEKREREERAERGVSSLPLDCRMSAHLVTFPLLSHHVLRVIVVSYPLSYPSALNDSNPSAFPRRSYLPALSLIIFTVSSGVFPSPPHPNVLLCH